MKCPFSLIAPVSQEQSIPKSGGGNHLFLAKNLNKETQRQKDLDKSRHLQLIVNLSTLQIFYRDYLI
jgi:hypothetical protein